MLVPKLSPWGCIDHSEVVIPEHVWSVSTPGHGGYAVDKRWARGHLSAECLAIGEAFSNCLWYEEDCAWAVLAWELPQALTAGTTSPELHDTNMRAMHSTIRAWYPLYCLAHSIPIEKEYAVNRLREFERMAERDGYWNKYAAEWREVVSTLWPEEGK